jgi:hypothetical protein
VSESYTDSTESSGYAFEKGCQIIQLSSIAARGEANNKKRHGQGKTLSDENRVLVERRAFTWKTVFFGFVRSRRRDSRRAADADPLFTDWHHPWLFFLATGIMIMSCLDAFLTLQLIERGAYEANPVMAAVMAQGVASFAMTKMALTGVGILALVFLARVMFFNRLRTGLILTSFFSFYAVLICYEFVNLMARL